MGYEEPYAHPCLPRECDPDPVEYLVCTPSISKFLPLMGGMFDSELNQRGRFEDELNQRGKEGWILCHLSPGVMVFYRPTKGREDWDRYAKMQAKRVERLVAQQERATKATGRSRQVFKKKRRS